MLAFDMSEYMERHTVSRLIGAPPGYVGYDEAGQLTEKVRRQPYSVVLFDEIEKAHHDVFNILLQVLEEGRLTDGKGRTVDFRNTVIIMTSNVGANLISTDTKLGFISGDTEQYDYERMKEQVLTAMKKTFRPEFLNRVDEVIVFKALNEQEIREIVELQIAQVEERLKDRDIHLDVSNEVKDLIAKEGFSREFGARPLRRVIERKLETLLSEKILQGEISYGDLVSVTLKDDKIHIEKAKGQVAVTSGSEEPGS
jgi:ATP-dependent Clp protease ATP-binding subunit ClpC